MGFWQALIGTKAHCSGCGQVVDPNTALREGQEMYCSQACRAQVVRLSTPPSSGIPVSSSSGVPTPVQARRPGQDGEDPHR